MGDPGDQASRILVRIRRLNDADDRVAYRVVLDDQDVGEIRGGEDLRLRVAPGKHRLHLRHWWNLWWIRSNILEFDASEALVEFECRTKDWFLRHDELLPPLPGDEFIELRRIDDPGVDLLSGVGGRDAGFFRAMAADRAGAIVVLLVGVGVVVVLLGGLLVR